MIFGCVNPVEQRDIRCHCRAFRVGLADGKRSGAHAPIALPVTARTRRRGANRPAKMGTALSAPEMTLGGTDRWSNARNVHVATCSGVCQRPTPGRVVP